MKIIHLLENKNSSPDFIKIMEEFLPFVIDNLDLPGLPKLALTKSLIVNGQPSFGMYDGTKIHLTIENRHPLDVLRTLAHELVHFKQDLEGRIGPDSGNTGSPEENEAHERAGIIMRGFNKAHPEFFKFSAIELKS